MATRSLGTLTLDLIAKIAGFEAGMDKAARKSKSTMDGIQKQVNNAAKAFAAFGTAAVASTVALVRSQINLADATSKTADRLGFTTEELSKLRYAAEMTGVAGNTFDMAMQRMTRRLGEATTGAGEAVKALQELNLDAQSLSDAGPAEAFKAIADALSQVPGQADRVRLAFKFFDSEGVKLVNTIDGGRAGIEAWGDELERLGGVIDSKAAKQAEALNDNLSRFRTTIAGTGNELAISLLPSLVEFTDLIGEKETQESIQSLVKGLADIAIFAARAAKATVELTKFLAESAAATVHGPAIGDMPRIDEEIERIQRRLSALREQQAEEESSILARFLNSIARSSAAAHGAIIDVSADASREIQELESELERLMQLRDLSAVPVAQQGAGTDSPLAPISEISIDLEGRREELEIWRQQVEARERAKELDEAIVSLMRSLRTDTEIALDNYAESMSLLNAALSSGVISQEQYRDAARRTADELNEMLDSANQTGDGLTVFAEQAARNMQSVFADFLFDPFDEGLEGMLKGFLKVIQRMAAEAAAAQIFSSIGNSTGWGWVGTAAGAVAGGRATGGPTSPNTLYRVNERGPELYTERGQTFLMSGGNGGFVTPLTSGVSGAPINVVVNIDSSGNADVSSDRSGIDQFGSELGRFIEQKYNQLLARDLNDGGQIKRAMSGGYR